MVCHGGAWLDCTWCTDILHVPVPAETGMLECLTYVNHLWVSMNQLSIQDSTTDSNELGKEKSQSRALRISSWKTEFPFPGIVWPPLWHCILDVLDCKFHPLHKATNQPTNHVFLLANFHPSNCWWKKSCTSWYGKYPIIYRILAPSHFWTINRNTKSFLSGTSTLPRRCRSSRERCRTNWPADRREKKAENVVTTTTTTTTTTRRRRRTTTTTSNKERNTHTHTYTKIYECQNFEI